MRRRFESSDGTQVLIGVIRELTGDTVYAEFTGAVRATVAGKLAVDAVDVPMALTYGRPNYVTFDIMWEDAGIANYRELGLYGQMSTQYQGVVKTGDRQFTVTGDQYEIVVDF